MSFLRFFHAVCATVFLVTSVRAQDAQEIIESVAKVYGDAPAYEAVVESRTIQFVFAADSTEQPRGYEIPTTQYRRLQLKLRRPHGYWLDAQTLRVGIENNLGQPPDNPRMNMMRGRPPLSSSLLVRSENTMTKQGVFLGGRFTVRDLAPERFNTLANSLLGAPDDLVLQHYRADKLVPEPTQALGLIEPELIGRESLNGRPAFRIVAKTGAGLPVMLWVDSDTYVIVRTIMQRPVKRPGASGERVSVVESFYKNQQLNPTFSPENFVISEPPPRPPLTAEQMNFIDVAALVKLAEIAPLPGGENESAPDGGDDADNVAGSTPATPPVTIDGQALSYEQMSGIILIEGDSGTATGFMTKIRDVDFVVTNLHVLGGNKKFTMKTLRGEEIQPLGIFGAVGSDIAIIRIQGALGELKLAEDVFKSTKIGDKVVVVGNRLGGGVATQTAGSIVGVGPTRVEVSANFESGNSGSPIVNLSTGEVVGVATYSETRRVRVEEGGGASARPSGAEEPSKVEKRWFGYRLDGVTKWEAIDLAKWNAQAERVEKFRETSEALLAVIRFKFNIARQHPRLTSILDRFESRYQAAGSNSVSAAIEIKDLFRVIRTVSDDGVRDLTHGDYYDYYRTCLYWQNSIPAQLEYRKEIIEVLKKYETNSSLYLSRMRGGN